MISLRPRNVTEVAGTVTWRLDEEAVKAFSRWKFKPATVRGEAVETYWYGSVNFRLQ